MEREFVTEEKSREDFRFLRTLTIELQEQIDHLKKKVEKLEQVLEAE